MLQNDTITVSQLKVIAGQLPHDFLLRDALPVIELIATLTWPADTGHDQQASDDQPGAAEETPVIIEMADPSPATPCESDEQAETEGAAWSAAPPVTDDGPTDPAGEPAPWTPEHELAVQRMLDWGCNPNYVARSLHSRLGRSFLDVQEKVRQLMAERRARKNDTAREQTTERELTIAAPVAAMPANGRQGAWSAEDLALIEARLLRRETPTQIAKDLETQLGRTRKSIEMRAQKMRSQIRGGADFASAAKQAARVDQPAGAPVVVSAVDDHDAFIQRVRAAVPDGISRGALFAFISRTRRGEQPAKVAADLGCHAAKLAAAMTTVFKASKLDPVRNQTDRVRVMAALAEPDQVPEPRSP